MTDVDEDDEGEMGGGGDVEVNGGNRDAGGIGEDEDTGGMDEEEEYEESEDGENVHSKIHPIMLT